MNISHASIHSVAEGHLGGFRHLTIMNNAVMNICVQGFFGHMFSFLLDTHLEV